MFHYKLSAFFSCYITWWGVEGLLNALFSGEGGPKKLRYIINVLPLRDILILNVNKGVKW